MKTLLPFAVVLLVTMCSCTDQSEEITPNTFNTPASAYNSGYADGDADGYNDGY